MSSVEEETTGFDAYEAIGAASTFKGLPRFGRTSDFSALFGSSQESEDYVVGLIFAGCLVGCFFIVWAIFLCTFCCMGQRRAGFLSGAPFRRPTQEGALEGESLVQNDQSGMAAGGAKPIDDSTSSSAAGVMASSNKPTKARKCSSLPMLRGIFLFCGFVYILFSVLLVTNGVTNLQSSVQGLANGAREVSALSEEASQILSDGLEKLGDLAVQVRATLSEQFQQGTFCPADPTLENSELGREISTQADEAILLLDQIGDFSRDNVTELEESIERVQKGAQDTSNVTENIDVNDWESLIILIPFIIIPALLMAACTMAFFDVTFPYLDCTVNWVLIPIFILMTTGAVVVCAGMTIAAGANADWCLPSGEDSSPDDTILQILEIEGYTRESKILQIIKYYIDQCTSEDEDPFLFLNTFRDEMQDSGLSIDQLRGSIDGDGVLEELSLYCNRDFGPLEAVLGKMEDILITLLQGANRMISLASCDRIVPIYTNVAYSATCEYSIKAVSWVFAACLIMGFSGMIMLTLRSSLKMTQYYDPAAMVGEDVGVASNGSMNNELELEVNDDQNERAYSYNGDVIQEVPAQAVEEDYGLQKPSQFRGSVTGSTASSPAASAHLY